MSRPPELVEVAGTRELALALHDRGRDVDLRVEALAATDARSFALVKADHVIVWGRALATRSRVLDVAEAMLRLE